MKKLFVGLLILVSLQACATWDARNATPAQKAYAVASDYGAIVITAAAYMVLPTANEQIKAKIKVADAKAYPAVQIMKTVASGNTPDFCDDVLPDDVEITLANSACNDDLPSVVRQTTALVRVLAAVVAETDQ